MRNLVLDRRNQPVRNLAANPTAEATSVNPATVRTNLALDPRGTKPWDSYGSQTITAVTGITGHPAGFTTANRVVYSAGSSNPGVIFAAGLAAGAYTISAWVMFESKGAAAKSGFGNYGSSAQSGTTASPAVGTWQRLSWSATMAGGTVGYRVNDTAGSGGSYLITGVLVEQGLVLRDYFDGGSAAAGDYYYGWSGAANGSWSLQRAPQVSGVIWNSNLVSIGRMQVWQSQEWSSSGSKSIRLRSSDPTTSPDMYVQISATAAASSGLFGGYVIGQTYTAKAKIRLAEPLTGPLRNEALSIQVRGANGSIIKNGTPAPNVAGVHDISVTFVAEDQTGVRIYHGGTAGSADIWIDDIMLVEGTYDGPFVEGTAYSESPLLIRNLFTNPVYAASTGWVSNWWGSGGASGSTQRGNFGPTGGSAWRKIWNVVGGALDIGVKIDLGQNAIREGKTYTFSAWIRNSWSTTNTLRVSWLDLAGASVGGLTPSLVVGDGSRKNAVPGLYTRMHITGVAPKGAVNASMIIGPYPQGTQDQNSPIVGSTLDVSNVMCTEGTTLHDYADGNTPGWKWNGVAGGSASYGYAYTLDAVLGDSPIIDWQSPESGKTSAMGLSVLAQRTIAVVFDWQPGEVLNIARLGAEASSGRRLTIATIATGAARIGEIFTSGARTAEVPITAGRNVILLTMNQGLENFILHTNAGSTSFVAKLPHLGLEKDLVRSDIANSRLIVWPRVLDQSERAVVIKQLANKYGATLSA